MRLCQEFLLGIGGVRMLRALGIAPTVWHANEGHSAFLTLERIRELIQKGSTHADACETIRQSTVFTTHTPVPAGHDVFPYHLMERYFAGYWEQLGLSREDFLRLGDTSESQRQGFNMTALAIRLAAHVNGVSREHGQVSREMWQHMWPGLPIEQVPIRSVTNGIHAPTWIAPELNQLYGKYLGPEWAEKCDDKAGNDKDVCVKQAKAAETRAKADAKANMKVAKAGQAATEKSSAARKDAAEDKRDADYAVAKEKCDKFSGDAKDRCLNEAKARFGK
jgi:starch phosphorylase